MEICTQDSIGGREDACLFLRSYLSMRYCSKREGSRVFTTGEAEMNQESQSLTTRKDESTSKPAKLKTGTDSELDRSEDRAFKNDPHNIKSLDEAIERLIKQDKLLRRRLGQEVFLILIFLVIISLCNLFRTNISISFFYSYFLLPTALITQSMCLLYFIKNAWHNAHDQHIISSLATQNDLKTIDSLIKIISSGAANEDTRIKTTDALITLLLHLRGADANLLSDRNHARLSMVIDRHLDRNILHQLKDSQAFGHYNIDRRHVDLRIAIIKALEQVDDGRSLPVVEKLAKSVARTEGGRRIKEAAESCLPVLRIRAEQKNNIRQLLRSADSKDSDSLNLLRSVSAVSMDASELLLRPAHTIDTINSKENSV